jgi:hypothetical protein
MGNGSPRLLRHLLVRTSACVLAMLVFAPPASADAGLVSVATPEPAIQSVGVQLQSAVPAAAAIPTPVSTIGRAATPASTPRIPMESAAPRALATSVARTSSVDRQPSSVDRQPVSGRSTPQQRPGRDAAAVSADSPSRHRTTTPQSAAGGIAATARVATVPTPDARAIHLTRHVQPGDGPERAGRAPLPQPPAPLPSMDGAAGGASSAAIALLLFALAAEAAAFVPPGVRRRIASAVGAPRPYPYLLRLERPD